jgi:hypothetical protein
MLCDTGFSFPELPVDELKERTLARGATNPNNQLT